MMMGIDSLKDEFGLATPAEVIRIVDESQDSVSTAEWGCRAFAKFTSLAIKMRSAEAMAQLMDEGICESLVNTMNTFAASSLEVAIHGCRALNDLSWTDRELREFLGEIGGCECLIFVLNLYIGNPEVSEYGSAAMLNLAKDNINNSFRFSEAGACDVIVQVGNFGFNLRHPRAPVVAANVCNVIAHLCEALNRQKLYDAGSNELITSLLKFHMDKADVVLSAVMAVCGLASLAPSNRETLGHVGACELIVEAMQLHGNEVEILQHSCEALMHLALSPNNTSKIGNSGGCEVILSSLDRHLMEREFGAEVCCGAMLNLVTYGSATKDNCLRLESANGNAILQRVLVATRASQRARENCQQLLRQINVPSDSLVGVVYGSEARDGSDPLRAELREFSAVDDDFLLSRNSSTDQNGIYEI